MSGNSSDAVIRQRSQLLERYADRLEQWTRARLPVQTRVDVAELVRDAIAEAVSDSHVPESEAPVLMHVRERLQTRIVNETDRQASVDADRAAQLSHAPRLAAELLERYDASLERLSPVDRLAIVARLELGLPWSHVLSLLDKPTAAAARISVSRALVRLAREMSL